MTLVVDFNQLGQAKYQEVYRMGKMHGCVSIFTDGDHEIRFFTTPEKARAIVDIINGPVDTEGAPA